ncbi:hypothetical protein ALT761_02262 [Alteromonas sp. 76-1]|jgi:hypothetical protein|uniref:hypothetical protein n=1 Tax=Alteromonas sp. 76-1 TaxID=2358187 RepID=UPI000FD1830D|nr:hypothetical protein [Alteromonas sp. 76-1]VEL97261.1 hypothetical protein ALT761_02262 [Alteromonas sp. 76-1]
MKHYISAVLLFVSITLYGCVNMSVPITLAENKTSFSYIPFDPLPVQVAYQDHCSSDSYPAFLGDSVKAKIQDLKISFPDQTVRLAVGEFTSSGGLSFGSTTIGYEGNTYQVVIDYMNTDTVEGSFLARREIVGQVARKGRFGLFDYKWEEDRKGEIVPLLEPLPPGYVSNYKILPNPESEIFSSYFNEANTKAVTELRSKADFEPISLPVYVGVGLRLTATVTVTNGEVDLSGLPEIAAEARAGNISGTLVVQTLGATGPLVSSNLPLPSELDRTTIQNAILAIGSIKALLMDESMVITPRVIGIYNPIGGGQSFNNGVITALATKPIVWKRPCVLKADIEAES